MVVGGSDQNLRIHSAIETAKRDIDGEYHPINLFHFFDPSHSFCCDFLGVMVSILIYTQKII